MRQDVQPHQVTGGAVPIFQAGTAHRWVNYGGKTVVSQKARNFIGSWAVTNVHAGGYKPAGDFAQAAELADTCARLAAAQDISREDLEAEVGDLDEHMRKALNLAQQAADVASGRERGPGPR